MLCFRLYNASGDFRTNGDTYIYEIQLSAITDSKHPECSGASICQVKTSGTHFRKIATSNNAKYFIRGKWVMFKRLALVIIQDQWLFIFIIL